MPWIITFSGIEFDLDDPQPDMVNLVDIARSLSRLPRFLGHTLPDSTYTVAHHSLLVSHIAEKQFALEALFHDAHEAYLGDIPSPVLMYMGPDFFLMRARIDKAIRAAFSLPEIMSPPVDFADKQALVLEKQQIVRESNTPWGPDVPLPLANLGTIYDQVTVRQLFFSRVRELTR